LSAALKQEACQPTMLTAATAAELVKAVLAVSYIRLLHSPLLRVLRAISVRTWRALPGSVVVDAVTAHAALGVEDPFLIRLWVDVFDDETLGGLAPNEIVKLVEAVALLPVSDGGCAHASLCRRLARSATRTNAERLTWRQLGKLAWGLAKLERSFTPPGSGHMQAPWMASIEKAFQSKRLEGGLSLRQLLWAFDATGRSIKAQSLFKRTRGRPLGRDAFGELLRTAAPKDQASILEEMASHCRPAGLRAAVLNAAVARCLEVGEQHHASELLRTMAQEELWTPVTYTLAKKLSGKPVDGRPPFPGLLDPGPGAHKYVRAAYFALARATAGDPDALLSALEQYSSTKGWLKFGAADAKGTVIEDAIASVAADGRAPVAVEFGSFLGYATIKMARRLGSGARIVTFELDPEVACLAINLIVFACVDATIDVRVGDCSDLVPQLAGDLGKRAVSLVYMDHNQITYHQDLRQLESLGLLADGALVIATQVLKPGAPLLIWRLAQAQQAGRCELEVVSAPDCGCPLMEDWVVLARMHVAANEVDDVWEPPSPPHELTLLAVECNLMRWRTAKGLVNEKCWNGFVQHVRRETQRLAAVSSSRDAWPDLKVRDRAQAQNYERMDY